MKLNVSPKSLLRQTQRARAKLWLESPNIECVKTLNQNLFAYVANNLNAGTRIACYVPIGAEPDLSLACWQLQSQGAVILLPRMLSGPKADAQMAFLPVTMNGPTFRDLRLVPNRYGIMEPDGKKAQAQVPNLIILPAMGTNEDGTRLGSGGGYYDRYLSAHQDNQIETVLPILPWQLIEQPIPSDPWDIKADIIIR